MEKKIDTKLGIVILAIIGIIAGCQMLSYSGTISITLPVLSGVPKVVEVEGIKKFTSEEEFKEYLSKAENLRWTGGLGGGLEMERAVAPTAPSPAPEAAKTPERVSTTTVQVLGIDEPDIVKTDGKEIYFSPSEVYYWIERSIFPPVPSGKTKIVKAFPSADLGLSGEIDKTGNLLLKGNVLIIFSGDKIYGYDVSDPKSPVKKWTLELESNNYLVGARLFQDKVYLTISNNINVPRPCPLTPFKIGDVPLEIKCIDIYHPVVNISADVTYTAMILNPQSGKIEKNISFVGSSSSSFVYMSEENLYLTYSYYGDTIEFFYNFFKEKCQDLIPSWLISKLAKLKDYDISSQAKTTELQVLWQQHLNSLTDDERLKMENEISNRIGDYYKEHKRDLEKTGIVKIGLNNFEIAAAGEIPGSPLNQFSLDEYQNNLRIATTVGQGFWGIWMIGGASGESANDVYVLDKDLKVIGSIKDLGLEEKIYSARFIEDKGYLVTFKQIDPFFVLDLSNPEKPELKGQLKIPGYSSYLHPITKDKILGIGKDGSDVKISLFDVSSPKDPKEIAKYTLDEYWSDILNTHHAFLLDEKHQIFFLPGSRGGYVFSYKDFQLKLVRAVSDISAKRAIYINDYLYIIGDNEIVVLNEINWEEVNNLEL